MTTAIDQAKRSAFVARYIAASGSTNRPTASFFAGCALSDLRAARSNIQRAERESPGSTGAMHAQITRLIDTLEEVWPHLPKPVEPFPVSVERVGDCQEEDLRSQIATSNAPAPVVVEELVREMVEEGA